MFLWMQDFDFFPNVIKLYPNLLKFYPIYPNWRNLFKFTQICSNFTQTCLKNLLGDLSASPAPTHLA